MPSQRPQIAWTYVLATVTAILSELNREGKITAYVDTRLRSIAREIISAGRGQLAHDILSRLLEALQDEATNQ